MNFKDQVIIITGAGAGLGKDYALYFASKGAKVVVNDLGGSQSGQGQSKTADIVVDEIKKAGGIAVANYDSVENGEAVIKTALDNFGRVDVLINNAGIIRDTAFKNMKKVDWDLIIKVHLNGLYACTKSVWDVMIKQKFGRIVNVSSPNGLYGAFGQANYAMAKAGIVGFTKTLAKEGEKYNIKVNCIAPVAATRMTENLFSKELLEMMKVSYITPIVAFLSHKDCEENGSIYECAGSWVAKVRYQRSQGVFFGPNMNVDEVKNKFDDINDFSKNNTYQDEDQSSMAIVADSFEKYKSNKTSGFDIKNIKPENVFELIGKYLESGEGVENVKKVQAIYQFDILEKKGGKPVMTYTIDMQNGNGKCSQGAPTKYDALFTMVGSDFVKVCKGELNPQMAFIQGKMKIKGNMKKATMFTPELFPKPTEENLKKYLAKF